MRRSFVTRDRSEPSQSLPSRDQDFGAGYAAMEEALTGGYVSYSKYAALEERNRELEAAAERAAGFIENLRVPQSTAEATMQVFHGGQALDGLRAALSKGTPNA